MTTSESPDLATEKPASTEDGIDFAVGQVVNASGHKDQLKRQYGLVTICALALTVDNAWIALGGSVTISIGEYLME
jgi:choline transport protein